MSIQKDLTGITEADLLALIAQPVLEDKTTEYKEALNIAKDEEKRKFLAGIASFANASGGDLIYGMKADDGRPVSLQALVGFNADATLLTLSELVRAHIDPKVYGIGFQPVPLAVGGHALVVRVPKTWAGAHMLTYGKDNRFYTRGANGRTLMDVPEIRAAFALTEATAERIRRFRLERIGDIIADETPVILDGAARMVVHLCPLVSFEPGYRCNLQAIRHGRYPFKPIAARGWAPAVDFDGDYVYTGAQKSGEDHGYSKLFRNGCVETVDSGALHPWVRDGKTIRTIPSKAFERYITESVHDSLVVLKAADVQPPLLLMISFIGVRGYSMSMSPDNWNPSARVIARDNLLVPELLVENFDLSTRQVAKLIRPAFDAIWNACGWEGSNNYNASGDWIGGS